MLIHVITSGAICAAPAVTEMYRGPERGFQPPRDRRSSPDRSRAVQHHSRQHTPEHGGGGSDHHQDPQKRYIHSQPELGNQAAACHHHHPHLQREPERPPLLPGNFDPVAIQGGYMARRLCAFYSSG